MAKYHEGCINGTLEGANYSTPIPVIGLYTAAASLLLLLIMLCDIIVAGFHARKRWLPCKYFKLNSVTITLISIATKLAVDLTTPMPRPVDQLSKLSATTLICVAMDFLGPSFGKKGFEWNTDLVSLTIFVTTVVVNICIQISTGAILLSIWEHIFIMLCMLLLLCHLWCFSWSELGKDDSRDYPIPTGNDWSSLYDTVTRFYEYRNRLNRQLKQCMNLHNYTTGGICVCCSAVLMQAVIRSLLLKRLEFCSGVSDYGWSMWTIVVTQNFFFLVGCFAVIYRWLAVLNYSNYNVSSNFIENIKQYVIDGNPLRWSSSVLDKFRRLLIFICLLMLYIVQLFFAQVTLLLKLVLGQKPLDDFAVNDWVHLKAKQDLNRRMKVWAELCRL